ncbi:hypothetical protein HSBAA_29100 [Vreelandella sulfidaeris]|uniref:Uncharacterized protein n=1 Tax=Vreelandella sulfidaeris TaxID=115553 RepID=A0A455UEP4_9GAMM|nr:hypothetical protein HSBAA_29100 [Halomonas sulfidaeris]
MTTTKGGIRQTADQDGIKVTHFPDALNMLPLKLPKITSTVFLIDDAHKTNKATNAATALDRTPLLAIER